MNIDANINNFEPNILIKDNKDINAHKILLELINKILYNIGKNNIDNITNFINIDRDDIIKSINKESLFTMSHELFQYFDKSKCKWERRNTTKNYTLTFLRSACNLLNYKLSYEKKDITTTINNIKYRKTHYFYSIK